MTESLLARINAIPPLPESVQEVERLYRNVDSTLDEMQVAIEKDPFLAANILRLVNSPLYELKTKVTNLKRAILLLGKAAIRTFVLSSSIDSNFDIDLSPYNMTHEQFQAQCELQMALAVHWLGKSQDTGASIVVPAAFMSDVGRLIISQTLIEDGKSALLLDALSQGESISQAEKNVCGATCSEVTAALFKSWELDDDLVSLIACSDSPTGEDEEFVMLCAQLKVIRQTTELDGTISDSSIAAAKVTIEQFGLDLEAYEGALEELS
ncbi:MAG: HDOD domain-containing protein [Campylobacterales bacterium]|nr:HDOD domain-containing protein [Campylobacterales bacterium]